MFFELYLFIYINFNFINKVFVKFINNIYQLKSSFRINNALIFIRNRSGQYSKFYNINQYFSLEEISEPVERILSNLKNIVFYNSGFLRIRKHLIGSIEVSKGDRLVTGKHIRINDSRIKYNINHYLAEILSPTLEMKLVFKIQF